MNGDAGRHATRREAPGFHGPNGPSTIITIITIITV
jgi:hypothetical protein